MAQLALCETFSEYIATRVLHITADLGFTPVDEEMNELFWTTRRIMDYLSNEEDDGYGDKEFARIMLLSSLVLLQRVGDAGWRPEPNRLCHTLLAITLLSCKMLNDPHTPLGVLARIGHVPVSVVRAEEARMLKFLNFRCHISKDEYLDLLDTIEGL